MSRDRVLETSAGRITIPGDVLAGVVARAAERVEGARVRRRRRIDVDVVGDGARVALELAAAEGLPLASLGAEVQQSVAAALRDVCGLEAATVDVAVEELEG